MVTARRWAISATSRLMACITDSRRAGSVSRISSCRRTRLGTLLTAPGCTSQVPTVATVSMDLVASVLRSIARISSAAAQRASRRSGMRSAPAWAPKPLIVKR